jgi:programmed cell death 6-interacting protein
MFSVSQSGAGVLDYLVSSILPKFNNTLEYGQSIPPDLTENALKSMELLMLAQAQECVWQRAVLGVCATVSYPS